MKRYLLGLSWQCVASGSQPWQCEATAVSSRWGREEEEEEKRGEKKERRKKKKRKIEKQHQPRSKSPTGQPILHSTFLRAVSPSSEGQSVEEKVAGFAGALARFCQNENSKAKQEIWFCHDREIKKGQVECKKKPRKQLIRNRRGGGRGWWNETSEKLNETRKEREGLRRVEVEEGEATTSQRSHLATAPHSQSPTLVHTWPRKDCVHRKQTRCQQNRYQRWTIGFSEWNEPIYKNNQPIK